MLLLLLPPLYLFLFLFLFLFVFLLLLPQLLMMMMMMLLSMLSQLLCVGQLEVCSNAAGEIEEKEASCCHYTTSFTWNINDNMSSCWCYFRFFNYRCSTIQNVLQSNKCPLNKVATFCQPIDEIHQLVIISTICLLKFKLNRSIDSTVDQSIQILSRKQASELTIRKVAKRVSK